MERKTGLSQLDQVMAAVRIRAKTYHSHFCPKRPKGKNSSGHPPGRSWLTRHPIESWKKEKASEPTCKPKPPKIPSSQIGP
jgi:hypothetical protein